MGALLVFAAPDLVKVFACWCINELELINVVSNLAFPSTEFSKVSFESPKPASCSNVELHDDICLKKTHIEQDAHLLS